ncbi:MAG: hypothetical protein ACR2FN_01645 [Chitinophagaceae bacterium]
MPVALFIIYFIFFCWLITKISFLKNAGLNSQLLIGLFVIKIAAGLFYGWFYALPAYISGSDTWRYFNESKSETDWLLKNPVAFIKDLFYYGYQQSGNLFSGENSYWNDLKTNVIIKLMAIFNVLSFKNYYVNVVFFNFLFFFGPVAFFRMMNNLYPQKKLLFICSIFLLPSFLFWCSGAHKDGFIFSAIALSVYYFYLQIQQKKIRLKYCLMIVLCFILIFILRNFILVLLIPAFAAWFFAERYPQKKWRVFSTFYLASIILFFLSGYFFSSVNCLQYVVNKQQEFKALSGNSQIAVPQLQSTFQSFIYFFPTAIDIAFFRPHITEIKTLSYLPAAAENILLFVIILISIVYRNKNIFFSPTLLFCLFFSLSILLLCGYTVTFSGAIVRYKSIVLPFLITPFVAMIDNARLKKFFHL